MAEIPPKQAIRVRRGAKPDPIELEGLKQNNPREYIRAQQERINRRYLSLVHLAAELAKDQSGLNEFSNAYLNSLIAE